MQDDKFSKALSSALSELRARGCSALTIDWKELVFVNPGGAHASHGASVHNQSIPKSFKKNTGATACRMTSSARR
jgi:hypothetical protein